MVGDVRPADRPDRVEERAMDEATFWGLIDRFDWSKDEDDDIIEPAVVALALLPDSEIADFQQILARKLYALDGRAWGRERGPRDLARRAGSGGGRRISLRASPRRRERA
jgi:hypothetical protein